MTLRLPADLRLGGEDVLRGAERIAAAGYCTESTCTLVHR